MATITYPSGTSSWAAVVPEVDLAGSAATLGTIELGTGIPVRGTAAALGLVLHITVTANDTTGALAITFDGSNDAGTTWFEMEEYDLSEAAVADTAVRVVLFPFTHGASSVRIQASVGTPTSVFGTIKIDARLSEIFQVVGGV